MGSIFEGEPTRRVDVEGKFELTFPSTLTSLTSAHDLPPRNGIHSSPNLRSHHGHRSLNGPNLRLWDRVAFGIPLVLLLPGEHELEVQERHRIFVHLFRYEGGLPFVGMRGVREGVGKGRKCCLDGSFLSVSCSSSVSLKASSWKYSAYLTRSSVSVSPIHWSLVRFNFLLCPV